MSAPQLPTGAKVPITMTSKYGDFNTTVTLGECLGIGGTASAYRISATSDDRQIQTDGSMSPLTDLVLRLEDPATGALAHRRDAINFLEERRPTDPNLKALVPLYASGDGRSSQVAGYDREMALSVQLLMFAGKDLGEDIPVGGLGWAQVCNGMVGVARALQQLHRLSWAHRDISPGNLFTGAPTTATPQFLVGDLGIITKAHEVRPAEKSSDGTSTLTQAWVKGPYTPPEVLGADGEFIRVTEYLDVWQLATTMAMLATGRLPFRGWVGGRPLESQPAYKAGVLSGRFDRDVIKDAPPALQLLFAKAWASEPSKRPMMLQLADALQKAAEEYSAKPLPASEPHTLPVGPRRRLSGSRVAAGAVVIALVGALTGALVAATDVGQSFPSFENLQRNTSTLVKHARDNSFSSAADETNGQPVQKLTPKPTPKPAEPSATASATHPATPSATRTPEQPTTLAISNPGLFLAGPLANEPIIGRLALPKRAVCPCSEFTQVKVKAEVTNESAGPVTVALGGASASVPAGPYLVFVAPRAATWKAERGAGVKSIRYPIDKSQPFQGRDDVILVPANPNAFARKVDATSYTWATHWATQTVAPGHIYRNSARLRADLVFTSPSGEAWSALAVIWVTDHGVLIGPLAEVNAEAGDF